MPSRRRPRSFAEFIPLEMTIDEFDRIFCAGHIATGDVEWHSTRMIHLDTETTVMHPGSAIPVAYSAINTPWTVLSARNADGAQALDAAGEKLASLAAPIGAGTWKPPVPKGPLGRHALLLRSAVERVDFPSRPKVASAALSEWSKDRPVEDGDRRGGFFDLTPEMLMQHRHASFWSVEGATSLLEGSHNPATLQELSDVRRV